MGVHRECETLRRWGDWPITQPGGSEAGQEERKRRNHGRTKCGAQSPTKKLPYAQSLCSQELVRDQPRVGSVTTLVGSQARALGPFADSAAKASKVGGRAQPHRSPWSSRYSPSRAPWVPSPGSPCHAPLGFSGTKGKTRQGRGTRTEGDPGEWPATAPLPPNPALPRSPHQLLMYPLGPAGAARAPGRGGETGP